MKDLSQARLASLLALLVGIWVLISPIWIGMSSGAQVSTVITGIVIIVASIVQYFVKSSIPSWINGIAAVWLFISTFVFSVSAGAAWSFILSAIATVILASWDGVEMEHFAQTHHGRMTTT